MRTYTYITLGLFCLSLSSFTQAENACRNVSCDCSNLPLESWKTICTEREQFISNSCSKKNNFTPQAYCSIHGPAATRVPLSIDLEAAPVVAENEIIRLNYKIAILYWSLYRDLDTLQEKVNHDAHKKANNYLKLISANANTLFDVQKQIVNSHMALNNLAEAQKSWREYSSDSLKIGNMLYDYGKAMLNAASSQNTSPRKLDTNALAFNLLEVSSRIYEQAAYAYSNGERHALASTTWKTAADISATLADESENSADENRFRQQAAMCLHKASYYWVVGQGENEKAISTAEKMLKSGDLLSQAL